MKVDIEEEVLTVELANELMPLLELHRQELSAFSDIELNVDVDKYIAMYNTGMYKIFIARLEGSIVGYLAYFIARNLHYNDYVYANQDVLYVEKSKRGAMYGSKIISFADKVLLKKYNVNVVTQHIKAKYDIEPIMARNGYKWVEKIYMKRLK